MRINLTAMLLLGGLYQGSWACSAQSILLRADGPTSVATGGSVPLRVESIGLPTLLRGDAPTSFPSTGAVTLHAPAGVAFRLFTPAPAGDPSLPATMRVVLRGKPLASVDFTMPYLHKSCALTYQDTTYYFTFLHQELELQGVLKQTTQFYRNGVALSGAVQDQYTATVSGTYTVRVRSGALGGQITHEVPVTIGAVLPVAAARPIAALQVYPNPCLDRVQVRNAEKGAKATIYDSYGRLVRRQPAEAAISLDGLASGVYWLRVRHGSEMRQVRITKQ